LVRDGSTGAPASISLQCILRSTHRLIDAFRTRIGNRLATSVAGMPAHLEITLTSMPNDIDVVTTTGAHSGRAEIARGVHRSLLLHRGFIVTPRP
jgi:hypothetical protein